MVTPEHVRFFGSAPRGCLAGGASASAVSSPAPLWGGHWSFPRLLWDGRRFILPCPFWGACRFFLPSPLWGGYWLFFSSPIGAETGPSANPPTYSGAHYYAPEAEEDRSQDYDPGYSARPGGW